MSLKNWLLCQDFFWKKIIWKHQSGKVYFLYKHMILPYHIGLGTNQFFCTKKEAIGMFLKLKARKDNLTPKTNTMNQDTMTVAERIAAPTPKIFRIIRNVGIIVASAAATIVALPAAGVVLPVALISTATTTAGIAGGVAALISQLTVDFSKLKEQGK